MSSQRAILMSVVAGCVIASATSGCMSPWAVSGSNEKPVVPPPIATSAPAFDAPKLQVGHDDGQADMASVLDKLQQVRSMDPAAEKKLLDELRRTPPDSWPLVAEQFRASLAYREKVASKDRSSHCEGEVATASILQTKAQGSRVYGASDFGRLRATEDDEVGRIGDLRSLQEVVYDSGRPSAPIGSLTDPRDANLDAAAHLARSTPYAMPSPIADGEPLPPLAEPGPPAAFVADGKSYPITSERVAQNSRVITASAAEPSDRQSGVVQAKLDTADVGTDASTSASAGTTAPATPGSSDKVSGASTADDDWQSLVERAAADLSARAAKSPGTTAEVHQHVSLRILRLLSGDTEKALEPIPGISPAEQDYWSRQLFALATYLDHHSQPDDKRRAAASVTHLDEAVSHLREMGSLSVRNLTFCKNVLGYGAVEPYDEDRFSPGQQVSLYVEVENYHSQSTEKGYCTSLGSSYELMDDKGTRIAGGEFPDVDDCCRTRRRDFHIQFGLALPEKLEPGHYELRVVVKDRKSDKIGNATAGFEIGAAVK